MQSPASTTAAKRRKEAPPLVSLPDPDTIATQLGASRLKPYLAMLFHSEGEHYNRRLGLITAHRVSSNRRGQCSIQPGRPLSPEDEMEILQVLRPRDASKTFRVIPSHLLHAGVGETLWWLAPHTHPMTLRTAEGTVVRDVMWPNLVMMATERRLYVSALKGDERPAEDTQLFHAPLANVWATTEVCVGNAPLPEDSGIDAIDGWTAVLRDSAFSHANHSQVIASTKKSGAKHIDPMDYWCDAKLAAFPDRRLVPLKIGLRDWIDFTHAVDARR